jgi:signal transduction histidine kinase
MASNLEPIPRDVVGLNSARARPFHGAMKLSSRFAALIAVLVVAVMAISLTGLRALRRMDASLHSVVNGDMARLLAATNTRREFRSMVVLERDHILERDDRARRKATDQMTAKRLQLGQQLLQLGALAPAEEKADVELLRGAFTRWVALDERVLSLSLSHKPDEAFALAQTHSADPVSWEDLIGQLVAANERRLASQVAATTTSYRFARNLLLGVSAGATLFAVLVGTLVFVGIKRNMDHVVAVNGNLEGLVAERTRALDDEKRSMGLVLDSIGDGLLTARLDGRLTGHRSRVVTTWFGDAQTDMLLSDYLWPSTDQAGRDNFTVAFEQLVEDFMPFDVSADMMPRKLERDGRHYELEYRQVLHEGAFANVLVVVHDVTARVAGEEAERVAREEQAIVRHLIKDKRGFLQCVSDCEHSIGEIAAAVDVASLKMDLHTLKGNSSLYGFRSIAGLCHALEDRIAESPRLLTGVETMELLALWRKRLKAVEEFVSNDEVDLIELRAGEHQRLVDALRSRQDYGDILGFVEKWRWGRTAEFLARLRVQIEQIATRVGKPIAVTIEPNAVRIPPGALDDFWPTLVHVVRNALDHGVEDAELRAERGKPTDGQIRLISRIADDELVIAIADDGAGIDFEQVGAAARRRGLIVTSDEEARLALFADGVSTRSTVTDLSGRGVGMGATRKACLAKGGRVAVHTELGRGTTFEFRFPLVATPAVSIASLAPPALTSPGLIVISS